MPKDRALLLLIQNLKQPNYCFICAKYSRSSFEQDFTLFTNTMIIRQMKHSSKIISETTGDVALCGPLAAILFTRCNIIFVNGHLIL